MAQTNVIKFPTRRVADAAHVLPAIYWLGPEVEELDRAFWSVTRALDSLARQKKSILARLHAAQRRTHADRHLLPLAADDGDAA